MIIKRLPRTFALRSLLLLVLICAVALSAYRANLPPPEVRQVRLGMTVAEIKEKFGKPQLSWTGRKPVRHMLRMEYYFKWGAVAVMFPPDGDRCIGIDYLDNKTFQVYRKQDSGVFGRFEKIDYDFGDTYPPVGLPAVLTPPRPKLHIASPARPADAR
jgi:hypothetical protein